MKEIGEVTGGNTIGKLLLLELGDDRQGLLVGCRSAPLRRKALTISKVLLLVEANGQYLWGERGVPFGTCYCC